MMKDFTPYETRPPVAPPTPEPYRWEWCTCGHRWHDHNNKDRGAWGRFWGVSDICLGTCTICLCPKFDKLGTLSSEEMSKIKEEGILYGTLSSE